MRYWQFICYGRLFAVRAATESEAKRKAESYFKMRPAYITLVKTYTEADIITEKRPVTP